jgi:hypothetical protein
MNYCITLIPQWLAEPGLNHFLIISAILFSLGIACGYHSSERDYGVDGCRVNPEFGEY